MLILQVLLWDGSPGAAHFGTAPFRSTRQMRRTLLQQAFLWGDHQCYDTDARPTLPVVTWDGKHMH